MAGLYEQDVEIHTANDTIKATDTLVYVGRMEAGVFFYDRFRSAPILIPSSEVKYLLIREKAKDDAILLIEEERDRENPFKHLK